MRTGALALARVSGWVPEGGLKDRRHAPERQHIISQDTYVRDEGAVQAGAVIKRPEPALSRAECRWEGYLPADASWTEELVTELLKFPFGKHDDQVDVLSLFGMMLDKLWGRSVSKPKVRPGSFQRAIRAGSA